MYLRRMASSSIHSHKIKIPPLENDPFCFLFQGDFNEDEEMKRMKMKAAQFEEDYKNRKKKIPAKLKPRVYGLLWTGDLDPEVSTRFNH